MARVKEKPALRKAIPELDLSTLIPPPHKTVKPLSKAPAAPIVPPIAPTVEAKKTAQKPIKLPAEKGELIQGAPKESPVAVIHHQPDLVATQPIHTPATSAIAQNQGKTPLSDRKKEAPSKPLADTPKFKKSNAEEVEARYKERQQKLAAILNKDKTSI